MKTKFLIAIASIMMLGSLPANATHYMGGEITWECLPNGNFRFWMKLYRECYTAYGTAANFGNTANLTTTVPGFSSITMTRLTGWPVDISPQCNTNPNFPHIQCIGMANSGPNMGAVQEHIYNSDGNYPNGVPLTGVPPPNGWVFGYTSCCRNPSTNIINSNSLNWYLRAIMYPYNNQNVSNCFDNSPKFEEIPRTVICTGYPFTYNHNATDAELDSLHFEWAQPWQGNNQPITAYAAGYSWNSPLPGPIQNPNNVAAVVNSSTGEISFESYTNGAFVTMTKVTAYKCGIKVAEIYREMQVVLLQCGTNTPPDVTPPFPDPSGQYTLYVDTVYAGDFVTFALSGTDFEFLPNGQPQTMTMSATGSQYGANFTSSTTGCLNPPCATLTPPPPVTGQFGVQTTFNWQTACQHLATNVGCGATSNVYTFVMRTQDDFCPAPAINIATITIVVLDQPQLPPPKLSCTEVLPSGDVTLTWTEVLDTMNSFDSYHIYHSSSLGGPFTVIDSIFNISTVTYTHTGAGANLAPGYYFMRTRSGCHANAYSPRSDTLASVTMDVVNPGAAFGVANLSWNPVADPPYPMMSGIYEVYREYPTGTWTQIASTSDTSYVDTITFCNQWINYKVEMVDTLEYDSTGTPLFCRIISSVDGDQFEDVTAPATQFIDTVSVDPLTNNVVMSWSANSSDDVLGYAIFHDNGASFVPIDTVWGINSTTWTDVVNDPCVASQGYQIAAFDSCGNASAPSPEHYTIKADITIDVCADEITLNWNDYVNMMPPVTDYEIWVSENLGPLSLLATVSPGIQTYVDTGLNQGSSYCYFIHAVNGVKSSTSCVACVTVNKPFPPQFAYLRTATVASNDYVYLKGYIDTTAYVTEYRIMRSMTGAPGTFTQIGTVPQQASSLLEFNDGLAEVSQMSYYYNFIVVDSCGVEVMESNTARTIKLDITPNYNDGLNTLTWNDYEGWEAPPFGPSGSPTNYSIYRMIDGANPTMVASLGSGTGTYDDDIRNDITSGGVYMYYVDAEEGFGNVFNFRDTSRSNTVQALHPPKLYVPNAFTPNGDGMNDLFLPFTVYIPTTDYNLQIYNRYGQLIWQTTDKDEGWDGRYDGNMSPAGSYVYYVKFTTSSGEPFEKRGTFLLRQ